MNNARRVPDADQMRAYLDRGLTHVEIADAWHKDSGIRVSRSTVSMAIARYRLTSHSPRAHLRHSDLIPWKLEPEHMYKPEARLLRLEGRRRAGNELRDDETTWLENWKAELAEDGKVVHYDGETPEGFHYVLKSEPGVVPYLDLIDLSNVELKSRSRGSRVTAPRDKRQD